MIVRKRRGRRTLCCLAGLMACSFFINTTYAWQQEYIAEAAPGHTTERYTLGQRSPTELQRHTGRTYSVYAKYGGAGA